MFQIGLCRSSLAWTSQWTGWGIVIMQVSFSHMSVLPISLHTVATFTGTKDKLKCLEFQSRFMLASFPGPRPASHHLQYGKAGEGLVHFLIWVMSRTGRIMWTWVSCKPQKNFACMHAVKRWQCTKVLSSWDSQDDRVLPSQDSEDTQQQFSCARPCSII